MLGHIGGVPVEEGAQALVPAASAIMCLAMGALAWLRRR
jgi:hypothetical protein